MFLVWVASLSSTFSLIHSSFPEFRFRSEEKKAHASVWRAFPRGPSMDSWGILIPALNIWQSDRRPLIKEPCKGSQVQLCAGWRAVMSGTFQGPVWCGV